MCLCFIPTNVGKIPHSKDVQFPFRFYYCNGNEYISSIHTTSLNHHSCILDTYSMETTTNNKSLCEGTHFLQTLYTQTIHVCMHLLSSSAITTVVYTGEPIATTSGLNVDRCTVNSWSPSKARSWGRLMFIQANDPLIDMTSKVTSNGTGTT